VVEDEVAPVLLELGERGLHVLLVRDPHGLREAYAGALAVLLDGAFLAVVGEELAEGFLQIDLLAAVRELVLAVEHEVDERPAVGVEARVLLVGAYVEAREVLHVIARLLADLAAERGEAVARDADLEDLLALRVLL